jgi:hypothetical protein
MRKNGEEGHENGLEVLERKLGRSLDEMQGVV